MDAEAARRARRKTLKDDLRYAVNDEEACLPEWADVAGEVRRRTAEIEEMLARETQRFASEPDIRVAVARRERAEADVRGRVAALNEHVRRLNLIAPASRLQRPTLDADEVVRPLYRTRRSTPAT